MLLWAVLFLIIIAISAVLAYRSMRDYQLKPKVKGLDYGLFLIRNPTNLTQVLDSLHALALGEQQIISFERLFKGTKSALVMFAPKNILAGLSSDLNLLELEEYTKVDPAQVFAWEVGLKDVASFHLSEVNAFEGMPEFKDSEQFWWQITWQANAGPLWPNLNQKKNFLDIVGKDKIYQRNLQKMLSSKPALRVLAEEKNKQKTFHCQIRAVLVSTDSARRSELTDQLVRLSGLVKIPKPYTSQQILNLYQQRSKMPQTNQELTLTTQEILQLCGVIKT